MPRHPISLRPALLLTLLPLLPACGPTDAQRKGLREGFAQYSARQFDASEAAADLYIQKNPTAPNIDEAYYLRGLSRESRGDKPAAAQDLQSAIAKSSRPDLKAKAYRALGDMAFDFPRWEQALDYYQKSISFVPAGNVDAVTLYHTGACLQSLGQWDRARPYFQRVISLNTDPVLTQHSIARMNARNFALQFAAFTTPANAAESLRQLKTAGIDAAAASELRDGKLTYLIRSGNYPTWEEANLAREHLLPKYPALTVVP